MTPEQFCYWLQGFFEISQIHQMESSGRLSSEQARIINDHLQTVFKKVTPPYVPLPAPSREPNPFYQLPEIIC